MNPIAHPLPELVSLLEASAEPQILFDRQYRILAANSAYRERFCGGRGNEVVGRTCYEVSHRFNVPCEEAGESCPLERGRASGRRERVLHLHHTPRGEEYVGIELTPIRDGSGAIAYFVEKVEAVPLAAGPRPESAMVGRAPAFQRMLALIARVAPSDAAVLLQGESGSGKELVAQAIHAASRRAAAPFVVVDCSGIPESLFESELFGHERGAFTGATARKPGLIEAACGGTLFLDELGDIPLAMQVKLLRLLETGTYRSVGSTELRQADLRVVSATHRDLRGMVAAGSFRSDLYYRLNTFPIRVPALRERREDIPLLTAALLARVAPGRKLRLSAAATDTLSAYAFPGNVRELRNLLERASLMADHEEIGLADLLFDEESAQGGSSPAVSEVVLSDHGLQAMLADYRGSRRALARQLGISERTLYRRIRRLDPFSDGS